jgi:hypothetical protein
MSAQKLSVAYPAVVKDFVQVPENQSFIRQDWRPQAVDFFP